MRRAFSVPMLPHLKKFAERSLFGGKPGPHKIEEDTLHGRIIMALLLDKRRTKEATSQYRVATTASLQIVLSDVMAERSPNLQRLSRFYLILDEQFKHALITWIKSAENYGIYPFQASKDFLAYYKIEEGEYSHDAAYKYYQRYKNGDFGTQRKKLPHDRPKITASTSSRLQG